MKKSMPHSFRRRLFVAFLAVSLVPLLLCSAMLLQVFRLRMSDAAQAEAAGYLTGAARILDTAYEKFSQAAGRIQKDRVLAQALVNSEAEGIQVYSRLFSATQESRSYAHFDLYDAQGTWRYSTHNAPDQRQLPTDWGVLQKAGQQTQLELIACQDVTQIAQPLLQGAVKLEDGEGQPAGYLVISLYQNDLRQLLEGTYGNQNDLILLSRYWRPVYCAQPTLASALAPALRQRLLAGEPLSSGGDEFSYRVEYHQPTGLYLVLRTPQALNRTTMGLLYTVSAFSALFCVGISILISLKLSRQMFRPIQRLRTAMDEVVQNNLNVQVPPGRDDELGELARRFNGMVQALKRNQQELVENQRELNQAQIRMLQAQLNPHFLCNTLDTMKWISKINQVPQVALMSTNLADILRFCISPDEFVPLRREVQVVERYIEIQTIRMSVGFQFHADIPEELEDCLVPKMILQPIVENAILHGLEEKKDGVITVRARKCSGTMLELTVEDNGKGLPPEMEGAYAHRDRELSRGHLGLYNVDTILRKYYGEESGLYLTCGPLGQGAVISATLPLRREEEEL